ncbi:MAG: diguanylate cyclase [Dehalococcoidia bacterium]|nr:diguanylate cyclase [Dehalococcoidia bacterium]
MAQKPALLQPLLDTMTAPLVAWGADGSLLACSAEFARLLDLEAADIAQRGRLGIVHPDDRPSEQARVEARRGGDAAAWTHSARFMTRAGRVVRASVRTSPLRLDATADGEAGDLVECIAVGGALDMREALDEQARQYATLFNHIAEAVYSLDSRGTVVTANPAAERLFGRTLAEMQVTHEREVLSREVSRQAGTLRDLFVTGGRVPRRIEFQIRRPDGELRWVSGSLLMMPDPEGGLGRSWVVARDVTALKAREQELAETVQEAQRQAKVDALTGLGNRRAFDEAWDVCGALAQAGQQTVIFVLDVDELKVVNDRAGHADGDEAIRAMGTALAQRTRGNDRVFRIGGDEFAVLVSNVEPEVVAERLREPVPFRDPMPLLAASVGWAVLGLETDDPGEAFRMADARMYEAKRERRAAHGR